MTKKKIYKLLKLKVFRSPITIITIFINKNKSYKFKITIIKINWKLYNKK